MIARMVTILTLTLSLGACAIGHKYDYATAAPNLTAKTAKTVSATVIDQRPYILSGNKTPDFVGLQRGGYGNPFNVTTQSGRPLAEDLTGALVRSLAARGVEAKAMPLSAGTSDDAAISAFRSQGSDRLLLVRMREWKTDAVFRLTLHWNIEASVRDASGAEIASNSIAGTGAVGAAGFETGNSAAAVQQISQKLGDLLNAPAIASALQ